MLYLSELGRPYVVLIVTGPGKMAKELETELSVLYSCSCPCNHCNQFVHQFVAFGGLIRKIHGLDLKISIALT